jgi:hypothetical protein
MLANGRWDLIRRLTLNLLTTTIVAPPSNARMWQIGLIRRLTLNLLTTTIVVPPSNASK